MQTTFQMKSEQPSWLDQPLWLVLGLNWEKTLHIVLIIFAVFTRFYDLGSRVISHDESLHTFYAFELYKGKGFVHTPLMHGTVHFFGSALSYALFGANDFTARIPAAVMGVLAVALAYQFRRWLGRVGALLAGLFILISPYLLYYTRYVREDPYTIVWALLMALSLFHYMERREAKWLYIQVAATALMYATKEVSFIYVAIWLIFLGLIYIKEMLTAQWDVPSLKGVFAWSLAMALVVSVVMIGLLMWSTRAPDVPLLTPATGVTPTTVGVTVGGVPLDLLQQAMAISGGIAALLVAIAGIVCVISFKWKLRDYASIGLMIVQLTFVLPQLTSLPVKFLLKADPIDYSPQGVMRTATVFIPLMIISAAIGLVWNWRRWAISAGIFYGIFVPLFTTMFTNGGGFFSGAVGSLGYWLEQHGVQRGSQPWYFYLLVQTPIYEFLPAIGVLIAAGFGVWYLIRPPQGDADSRAEAVDPKFPVPMFLGFWTFLSYIAYSWAGEKMPWLQVHNTIPMVLLAGWSFGKIVEAIDVQAFRQKLGWVVAILSPLTLYAFFYSVFVWLGTNKPFQGNDLAQLQSTSSFLFSGLVAVAGGAVLFYIAAQGLGWKQLSVITATMITVGLTFLTMRASFYANYVNYDYQTEFINYASGAPGVKVVMAQVEEISKRTTDGLGVRVAYDDDVSWPLTWYMRDYTGQVFYGAQPTREVFADTPLIIAGGKNWPKVEPLLGDRYYMFEYIRMWWPMQEYFNLDSARMGNAINDPKYREALFDIWFYRDYKKYGQITNVDYALSKWPVSDRMRFYIRKDIAAKLWSMGVGPTALKPAQEDPYVKNKQQMVADVVWGGSGNGDGQFNSPRAVAASPLDGSVYVADTRGSRIQQFDPNGKFIRAWGKLGKIEDNSALPGTFSEIWGIAVDKQGNVFASDTWNHRIQKFSADGKFISSWGTFGLTDAGLGVMWGPRGVAVDASGNVYVADTGNKRILVFDNEGKPIRSIGSSGVLQGQLDEPASVAVASDGRVFVADTWNQRVQAFSPEGAYLGQWAINGWFGQSLDNKPVITLDQQGNVYISDPEQYRIIVFNEAGQFQYMFGDLGADNEKFTLPVGLAFNNGALYVTDAGSNRVLKFAPKVSGAK